MSPPPSFPAPSFRKRNSNLGYYTNPPTHLRPWQLLSFSKNGRFQCHVSLCPKHSYSDWVLFIQAIIIQAIWINFQWARFRFIKQQLFLHLHLYYSANIIPSLVCKRNVSRIAGAKESFIFPLMYVFLNLLVEQFLFMFHSNTIEITY